MRKFLEIKLARFAKNVIRHEKPMVIAVTGSVGKSSAKDAIGVVLAKRSRVRVSPKSYNEAVGLPLTVLGERGAKSSKLGWLGVLWRSWKKSMGKHPDYPAILVLEMGLQRPGDIARLCDIAPPDVGVVTAIGESHMEFMGSIENIIKEKGIVLDRLPESGLAVLNRDDSRVWEMRGRSKAKVMSYGYEADADVRALIESVTYACTSDRECGMHLKISANGETVAVFLPHVMGRHGAYGPLAAAAIGLSQDMTLVEIANALGTYTPPPGRMRHVPGIKHTVLIDDSYNASPMSCIAALAVLQEIPKPEGATSYAVLGDMLELGAASEDGHALVGKKAAKSADVLVFVGERMRDGRRAAIAEGLPEDRAFWFASPEEAGLFVQDRIKMGDFVLIKGSRGMAMEKVVKELMADPLRANEILVNELG